MALNACAGCPTPSAGRKQRICIVRALAAEPGFIICDPEMDQDWLDNVLAERGDAVCNT